MIDNQRSLVHHNDQSKTASYQRVCSKLSKSMLTFLLVIIIAIIIGVLYNR